jgi:hypothetical protein
MERASEMKQQTANFLFTQLESGCVSDFCLQ